MKCNETYRSGPLFEGHKAGGVYLGKCPKEALEGFVVCFEHVNKEALWMMVQHKTNEIKKLQNNPNPYLNDPDLHDKHFLYKERNGKKR